MSPGARRIVGVDTARCVALLGMMATHVLPGTDGGGVTFSHQLAAGRASALFAVLAGVSLVLVAGRRTPVRGAPLAGLVAGTVVRSAVVGLVGLVIGGFDTGIAVILAYYAVLFVVAVPFLALPTRGLVVVAATWAVVAPVVSLALRRPRPGTSYTVPSLPSLGDPGELLRDLLLTGYYPVLTWVPLVLAGVVVGRLDLRAVRTAAGLALFGGGATSLAVLVSDALTAPADVRAALVRTFEGAGWRGDLDTTLGHGLYGVTPTDSLWWLAVRAPHSGTTFDLLATTGTACLVLAVALAAARVAPRLLAVVFGAGAMTLTLYTVHVLLRTDGVWDGEDTATYVGQVALVLAVGAGFRLAGRRGPLEWLVGVLGGSTRTGVEGRARAVGRVRA